MIRSSPRLRSNIYGATIVIAAFGTACTSEPTDTDLVATPAPGALSDPLNPSGVIHNIGRGLAMALNDASVRAWVRAEMDKSPYVEWRITFKQNLSREAARPQIKRIVAASRLGATAKRDIKSLPELELYMPIPEHLKSWRGEAPVQVAVPVKRDEEYIIYSLDGSSKRSRGDYIPQIPTLVLGPSEIEYDDLESALRGGRRTGEMMSAAAVQTPLRPSFGISTAQHTRLTYFRTLYNHDDFFGGTDEVETFGALGNWFTLTGAIYKECTRYTGVSKNIDYYLPNDAVRTIATAVPTGAPDKVYIHAFEDDNEACVFHVGDDDFYGKLSLGIEGYGTIWGTIRDSGAPGHINIRVHAGTP